MMEELHKVYYDLRNPASFSNVKKLKNVFPEIKTSTINRFLQKQLTYTTHKSLKKKFVRRKVIVPGINYLWQADLVILPKLSKANDNYKHLLCVIDCFSKLASVEPLKTKSAESVSKAFLKILEKRKDKPKYLQTDLGTEFYSKKFRKLLKENRIELFSSYSELKAQIVERFQRTLLSILFKYLTSQSTKRYIDVLNTIVNTYNHTKHSSIGIEPVNVNKENEMDVWMTLYKKYTSKKWKQRHNFKANDFVRINRYKGRFVKGYSQTFTNEIFRIKEVVLSRPITYKLFDSEGDDILGIFYKEELSKVLK